MVSDPPSQSALVKGPCDPWEHHSRLHNTHACTPLRVPNTSGLPLDDRAREASELTHGKDRKQSVELFSATPSSPSISVTQHVETNLADYAASTLSTAHRAPANTATEQGDPA